MNFESKMIEKADIDSAYRKAIKFIKEESIDMNSFRDLYGDEVINADLKYVRDMESRFSQRGREDGEDYHEKLATIFEIIVTINSETNNWLGENSFTYKTSRYDDIKNGVDMVAEFIEDDELSSHVALAVDVTKSGDLAKKFRRIREEIRSGKLATIKYFISNKLGIRGELSKIPKVVIGASGKTITELTELWLRDDNLAISEHFIQFQILEEILMQIEKFASFAESIGQSLVANAYKRQAKTIRKILEQKAELARKEGADRRDEVFWAIKYCVDNFEEL